MNNQIERLKEIYKINQCKAIELNMNQVMFENYLECGESYDSSLSAYNKKRIEIESSTLSNIINKTGLEPTINEIEVSEIMCSDSTDEKILEILATVTKRNKQKFYVL